MPHGYCLAWSPFLLWLHVGSDLLISIAYYSIPLMLVYFNRQRKDFPYPWLVTMFAGFIVACGTTHLVSVITIWLPIYWFDGWLKGLTAIISVATAVLMLWVIPRAMSLPSTAQLNAEIQHRKSIEDELRNVNLALQKNMARTQLMVDAALDGIISMDQNGNVVAWNRQAEKIFGYASSEALGQELAKLIIPASQRERHRQGLARFRVSDEAPMIGKRLEMSGIRADNSEFPIELTIGALYQEDGIYFSAYVRDISERKIAETALRESENKLATILDSVEACIYIKDESYRYQYANKSVQKFFGRSMDDIIGKMDDSFFSETTVTELRKLDQCIIERGERIAKEEINTIKDSTIKHVFLSVKQPLRRDDGTIYGLCGISTDITELKNMEEKLRDSHALNESILNSLTSHIAVLDAEGVIVAVNNAWRQFAEENNPSSTGQNMLGSNYLDACKAALDKPFGDEACAAYEGILAVLTGDQVTFELEYPCHSPTQERWFHMTVTPLQDFRRGVVVKHVNITERKEAERVLRQLEAMINISLDGFWIVDMEGRLLQVNQSYANISGYTLDELKAMTISELEGTESPEQTKSHIANVMAMGYDLFETTHRHKDGHIIDVEISVAFLSEFQHFCVFCRDITERKAMEKNLRASEAKFRSIIEVSPVPMALNDDQYHITYLNPAFVQTFGYSLADIALLTDWWQKAYPDQDYRSWVKSTWQSTLEKAKNQQIDFPPLELTIQCKDSQNKTVLASAAPIQQDFQGEHLVILYDITQRKQMEAKLNAIFNAAVEGIITIDSFGKIVSINTAVEGIFGYNFDALSECKIQKLMPSFENYPDFKNAPFSEFPDLQIQEIEGVHKNGNIIPLDLSLASYSIDNKQFSTFIVRDISLRKAQEQKDKEHLDQLAHATRLGLMGEMASGIAHEVNQPLSAISSYTSVIISQIETGNCALPKLSEILTKIQQQSLRAGQIIHRMKNFVKSSSNYRSETDINALLHDASSLCSVDLKLNGIKLVYELEKNLPIINVDQIQIEQVVINLIRNSIDALKDLPITHPCRITISSCLVQNESVRVSIIDNGPGIEIAQQQKIGMPFFTTKIEGMGMGLSISRSLIEAHQGTLRFTSKPGEGSTFYFTLPVELKTEDL